MNTVDAKGNKYFVIAIINSYPPIVEQKEKEKFRITSLEMHFQ